MFFFYKDRKIGYNDCGKGTTIVLLHGYLETSAVWDDFSQKLSENFRVISVDLPGHGLSESYGSILTMEFMAGMVKELLDSLELKKVFLTGHSLGGYVTLAFAELYSGSLSGYCLFHSQPFPDTPEAAEKRMREISLVQEGRMKTFVPDNIVKMFGTSNLEKFPGAVERSKEIASGIKGEGIIAVLNGMMERPSRLPVMEEGIVPCLWILGALDNFIPCNTIQTRVKLPSNTRVVVLQNSGHMGFVEEAEKSLQEISEFIREL